MTQRLQSIRPRLEELARLDPDLAGAEGIVAEHEYQLAPPVEEAEVIAFESEHCVTLPTDYRRFLLEVGSHGAGPGYGLNRLGDLQHLYDKTLWPNFFASPFPLTEWMDISSDPTKWSEDEIVSNKWVTGAFCLSHWGCGMYDLLVLTGQERDHVWQDDRMNEFGIFPVAPNREQLGESQADANVFTIAENDERTSFLDWYEWWLDWSLKEIPLYYQD